MASTIPVPTREQLDWLDLEVGVIIHLDMQVFENSYHFRDRWGYTPDAQLFDPKELDTDQWLATAEEAGAKYALFTAKHNSGFSFWPTKAHPYSVASAPWRGGKEDIVADFIASCEKYGLRPGLYCSASANAYFRAEDPGLVRGGTPEEQKRYNDVVIQQYREVWGNYGPLVELWFDGGFVPPGEGGPPIIALRDKLQPQAVIFSGACSAGAKNRIRPSGSEEGRVPLPSWGAMDSVTCAPEGSSEGDEYAPAEGVIANREGFDGGWFWHEGDESAIHSPSRLLQGYYDCVGRNANFLVGMVVDNRGLVPNADAAVFREFGELVRKINALPRDTVSGNGRLLELPLAANGRVSEVLLKEGIAQGERVRKYQVEALVDGTWRPVADGDGIGHKRLLSFAPVETGKLRLHVLECAGEPEISEFSAYLGPVRAVPKVSRDRRGMVTIAKDAPGELRYTLDGSAPTATSTRYTTPFVARNSGTLRVRLFPDDQPLPELSEHLETTFHYGLPDDEWEVIYADSEYAWPNGSGRVDSKDNVLHAGDWLWRSGNSDGFPHELVIDMKKPIMVDGFIVRTDNLRDYEFYVGDSPEQVDRLVAKGVFEGMCPDKRLVRFDGGHQARYCRLRMLSNIYGRSWVVVRSLEIIGSDTKVKQP